MLHIIVDVSGKWFARDYTDFAHRDAPKQDLPRPEFAAAREQGKWTLEMAVPIRLFGEGAEVTGFNFGRNRVLDAVTQTFSAAPGKAYRNFSANFIQW